MEEFSKLVELMATLRAEKGCPWDRKQTTKAFKTFLLEEVYELIDAIEKDDSAALEEELGDLLFHIVFISQICKEESRFDIRDVLTSTYNKMYNRHPHVFSDMPAEESIEKKWEEIKREENPEYAPLSGIPRMLPALLRAYTISRRAAKLGFDWEKLEDIHEKLSEEIRELKAAEDSKDLSHIKEEIGDILFTMVNIARFHNIDPEDALRFTSDKFVRRFSYVENNTDVQTSTLTVMDGLWDEAKKIEREEK
jgi:tetrapyrrole methylase family protein / MazG family protein